MTEAEWTAITDPIEMVAWLQTTISDRKMRLWGIACCRHFYWQLGTSFGIAPRQWLQPAGYISRAARTSRREQARTGAVNITPGGPALSYEGAHATYQIVSGNPDTVVKKLQHVIDLVDPAYMTFWGREGLMSHDAAIHSIDLMTREVIPAIKAYRPLGREKMSVTT